MLTRWSMSFVAGAIIFAVLVRHVVVYGPFSGVNTAVSIVGCFEAGAVVFLLLQMLLIAPVSYVNRLIERAADSSRAEATALEKLGNPGWERTTVTHLEALKCDLNTTMAQIKEVTIAEIEISKVGSDRPVKRWFGKQGLRVLRQKHGGAAMRVSELRYQIERIYRGEVDPEIANYREEITQLRLEHEPVDKDLLFSDFVVERNKKLDARIRRCERNIAELEQWRAKVSAANALVTAAQSPHEAAWRNFIDIAKRTAAAPIIEARSRVEAVMTGIEAKRQYERLVADQWRRGVLTDEEADYIRQRIREEFLGVKNSIYE